MSELSVVVALFLFVFITPALHRVYFGHTLADEHDPAGHGTDHGPSSRVPFFDAARGVAIIAVVAIHSAHMLVKVAGMDAIFLDAAATLPRFAIPFFFLASGILLTPPARSLSGLTAFFVDKLKRVFIPYLLWNAALALWFSWSIVTFILFVISGNGLVPYYFISLLFQFYLLYPFIEPLARKKWFLYAAFGTSLISLFVPVLQYAGDVPLFFRYLIFFAYGIHFKYYFRDQIQTPRLAWEWVVIALAFLVGFTFEPDYYYNIRIFWGIALFHLFFVLYRIGTPYLGRIKKLAGFMGRHSLWIFLAHFPIQYGLFMLLRESISNMYALYLILTVVTVVAAVIAAVVQAYLYRQFWRAVAYLRNA